jgi:retinol-binding protein 3
MPRTDFPAKRTAVIQDIIRLSREKYVYPEMGEIIASQMQARLESGVFDDITNENDLAFRLTTDLQAISNDHHWSVVYDPAGASGMVDPENEPDRERMERYQELARKSNYGFERVEHLKGNIGYIDLRSFEPAEYGGETAVAAMNLVANSDALIIDLRKNHGGFPSMVQLIISYLTDPEAIHINSFYYHLTDDTQQFWTFPHVPGKRRPDIPVYVLTSNFTASGAEEFSYDLKAMERATLVGETTSGAAHPVTQEIVQGDFDVRLPYGRPINPITKTNWEGVGVEPHISVPAEEALKKAHLHALELLMEKCGDETEKKNLAWMVEIIASEYDPPVLEAADLLRCTGEFGKRTFLVENGYLLYRHQDAPAAWKLTPLTKTRFRLDEDVKFEFTPQQGRVLRVIVDYTDGRPQMVSERTG